jgi:U3 small nucleolar RNA-associated protein 4
MAFDPQPQSNTTLILGQVSGNGLHVFDVELCAFPDWARALVGGAGEDILPKGYASQHDPLIGLCFIPVYGGQASLSDNRELVAWGSNWLCRIVLNQHSVRHQSLKRRKLNRSAVANDLGQINTSSSNFKFCHRYRNILLVDALESGELVVVERPVLDLMKDQPPPFFKHRFGS